MITQGNRILLLNLGRISITSTISFISFNNILYNKRISITSITTKMMNDSDIDICVKNKYGAATICPVLWWTQR